MKSETGELTAFLKSDSKPTSITPPLERKPATVEQLFLSAADMAKMLSVSPRTVWRLRDAGQLPAPVKLGKLIRWRRDSVLRFLDEQQTARR